MSAFEETYIRPQLIDGRQRLRMALGRRAGDPELSRLLAQVDAALERLDDGTYGLCQVCHDPVEPDRLLADPLVRFCLDHLDEREQRALEQDLETAAALQRRLLPPPAATAAGWEVAVHWRPAGVVSGDFVDLVARDDDAFALVVADVAGKGVAAGLVTTHLHAAFRALLAHDEPVDRTVGRVNRLFRDSALSPHYATLLLLRAHRGGALEVCNAGHWPPFLLDGGAVTPVDPTGMPVGAFYSTAYASRTLAAAPGGTLFAFTDGLVEARDDGGAEYGAARLADRLAALAGRAAAELVEAVADDLARHLGGRRPEDDLTLVALRRLA